MPLMAEDARQDMTGHTSALRVSVQEAAEHLGTTVDAIRKRVQRDTIAHEKDPDGRVWVLLDTDRTQRDPDQDATGQQQDALLEAKDGTIADLRDRVASLERQLERRETDTERLHQVILGLAQTNAEQARTIRAIEAPASEEATEDAETVDEAPEKAEPRSDAQGPQTDTQPPQGGGLRGLRRRILGW
jgi:hypothetical protein